jgi:ComF family protein
VVALGWYSGDLGGLCLELKRKPGAWLGEWLGYWLARYRRDRILGLGVEVVVPVPLHWWRRWRRGHNQAERIAWGLARELKLPLRPALRRVRSVEKLASLSRTERLEAMKGAFSVVSENRVRGRTILLVDDVLTSGATCGAAARALKAAGAKRVVAAVVARTDRERA